MIGAGMAVSLNSNSQDEISTFATNVKISMLRRGFSLPRGRQRGTRLRSRLPHPVWCHSIDYCDQGIDGAAQHGAERRVAFNAVRLPIRRIVGQYSDVARAALCAFKRDDSIFARDRRVAL